MFLIGEYSMKMETKYKYPDKKGYFGYFGGKFLPETLIPALEELEEEYEKIKNDGDFQREFIYYLQEYAGRPTILYFAHRLTNQLLHAPCSQLRQSKSEEQKVLIKAAQTLFDIKNS